jgi:hypothetical protein
MWVGNMSKNYVFGHMVATAIVATNLKEMSRRLDREDCGGMFVSALSATGALPATHYISSGWVPRIYAETLTDSVLLYTRAKKAWEDDGDVFPYTQLQVTNALNQCTITNGTRPPVGEEVGRQPETGLELIVRLGLKQITGII